MHPKYLAKRRLIYGALFAIVLALASIGLFTQQVQADWRSITLTVPPPGATIPATSANLNFVHLAPFGPDTTVSLTISSTNSLLQYEGLEIGDSIGGYISRPPGTTQFSLTLPGDTVPVLTADEQLNANVSYTEVAIGGANGWPLELLQLVDTTSAPPPLHGKVRVVHVAPFAPPPASNTEVDIVTESDVAVDPTLVALEYKEASPYLTLPAREYDWKVVLAGTSDLVVDLPPFNLYGGAIVTLFVLGDGTNQPPAGLLMFQQVGEPLHFIYMPIIENVNILR
jgi:hypothetical protein